MNYLSKIQSKVKAVKLSIDDLIANTVGKNEVQIKEWIRDRWITGVNSEGNVIGFYKFEEYAQEKYEMNKLAGFGNADLTYSGEMGRSIEISGFNNEFEVFSTVSYFGKILEDYGESNFNITGIQKEKLTDIILKAILYEINKAYA